ncbi:LytR/AlgR family response regulator transcription factor [Pontimicrobium aquaticum]|uniref:Response regulator transcription factor n=1 Tax=Pontimicrobium aquaticum TaxID=2565367 RepID=A0A4U0F035_9FLAO|nr:LytTR family DNA-binding domain-containing protein [Pontimicrobium aquaticum]TJY37693.1 response regulator transcription factor [Pontimicrobium aquaticum]
MCTYFIIEPNKKIASDIKRVFDEFPDFKYLGTSATIEASQEIIYTEYPKLLLVDFDQSNNLFSHINEIKQYLDNPPKFIALSTTTDMAYIAIKNNFFDYLIKPINELELRKAALRFKKKCNSKRVKKNLCLKSYKDYHYIDTEEIVLLKADNNSTDFILANGSTVIAYKTLKTFETLLPSNFVRIHKSYIVNIDYVNRVNYGKNMCSVRDIAESIPFTKTYMNNIERLTRSLSESSVLSLN